MTGMPGTWRIRLARQDGSLIIQHPEAMPDWVQNALDDLTYRFRESPDASAVTVQIDGRPTITEEPPDAAAGDPTPGEPGPVPGTSEQPDAGT